MYTVNPIALRMIREAAKKYDYNGLAGFILLPPPSRA